jgi:ganglioside GM2 activator
MEKKVAGFYIKVPCIDNVGSCTYGDLCKDWADVCPKYFSKYGIPCACPIPANTYTVPDIEFDITGKLPPGASGDLRVTANMNSPSAGHLGCLQVTINLQ